jgi:hypothetical protein
MNLLDQFLMMPLGVYSFADVIVLVSENRLGVYTKLEI